MSSTQQNRRASIWLLGLVALVGYACGRGEFLHHGLPDWVAVLIPTMAILAVCEWFSEQRWSLPLAIGAQVAAATIILCIHPSWLIAGLVAGCLLVGAALTWFDTKHAAAAAQLDDEEAFQSIVLLMREPMYLDSEILKRLATDAWAVDVEAEGVEEGDNDPLGIAKLHPHRTQREELALRNAPPTLYGDETPFMCLYWPALLAIHNNASPYFDDVAEDLPEIKDPTMAEAVANHGAWLSVDLVSWLDEREPRFDMVDRLIGQLLAELADHENCVAVIDLVQGHIYPFESDTVERLRDPNPRRALSEPTFAPDFSEDEELRAVSMEAKRRWPDFVRAFEGREDRDVGESFSVRARFVQESFVEYIWVTVTAIEANIIYGQLDNNPLHISGKMGDCVRVPLGDLNDWVHLGARGERLGGGFSIDAPRRRDDKQEG